MKQTVHFHTFQQAFEAIRPDNFSYEGLTILFDYLIELENDIGEELELDVIAICCDFSEDTPANIAAAYNIDVEGCDDEETLDRVVDALNNEGAYIGDNVETIVYRQF